MKGRVARIEYLIGLAIAGMVLFIVSCSDDEPGPGIDVPASYTFERNGASTVAFPGQTTRILMGEELVSGLLDFDATSELLLEMYRNETETGGDANPFENPDLNASTKSIRNKTAASQDFFSTNVGESNTIKQQFEAWIQLQVNDVYPAEDVLAAPGVAGQIADGSSVRYVNTLGLEYNQIVNKGLIGALMLDQAINNYLSTAVLDDAATGSGTSREANDAGILVDGENYTNMEHKWDEAYGYCYGTSADPANPNATIGSDDSFLNKYIGRVEGDPDFAGIADRIYDAFKTGRAAIVAGDYTVRDRAIESIKEELSNVIAIRAVYYMQQGKFDLAAQNNGSALHNLSEGAGFIYSLRFTQNPATGQAVFNREEVDQLLNTVFDDGVNGFWDVQDTTLDSVSTAIADRFNFTVAEAAEAI